MKAMYKVGYFLILITVLIPISAGYVMQGGLAAGWLLWFSDDMTKAVLLYRISMLLLQVGAFTGCVLFFRSYVPEKNRELLVLMGTALYMLSPIWFYVCYDLGNFAIAFFRMGIPFVGWAALKARQQWMRKQTAGMAAYSAVSFLGMAVSVAAILMDPAKSDFEMLRERYYLNDMFSAFIYRTAHPGWGLGLMLAAGLYGWWIFVKKQKLQKREVVTLVVVVLSMLAAGCNRRMVYGPLLAMCVGTDGVLLLVTGRDYVTVDETECGQYRLWIYGTIAACFAVGTYLCNMLMYYRAPLN